MIITGDYHSTIRRNYADGWTTFNFVPSERMSGIDGPILQCIGQIRHYTPGLPIVLEGDLDGQTFRVANDRVDNTSRWGIRSMFYIAAKGVHGAGVTGVMLDRLEKICCDDVFSFCADDDNLLVISDACQPRANAKDPTDPAELAAHIVKNVRRIARQQELVDLLRHYSVPYEKIDKMTRKSVSLDELRESPYIVMSRYDVPITIADAFALGECGVKTYSYSRCLGIVYAAMRYLAASGNTYTTLSGLVDVINTRYARMLGGAYFGPSLVNVAVLGLGNMCEYIQIDGHTYIYISRILREESNIVYHIQRLQRTCKNYNTDITVDDTAAEIGINYNAGQRAAFELLKTSGVKILTGPPGSGKTATINGLIRNFEANGNGTVHLAATTGMAARVMRKATDRDAETANAMLRVVPYDDTIRGRDLNDPVDADLIIVDEISMMGVQLFSVLVGAARGGSIVLLVGDEHQLQSVEYGNVLHDLIASGEIEVCRLTEILRQSGTICTNAARVNAGDTNLEEDTAFAVKSVTEQTIQQLLAADYDPTQSQIISPIKGGPMGTVAINNIIQARVNGHAPVAAVYGRHIYRNGDKIVMTRNNYDAGYINGDIGYIREATTEGDLMIDFPDGQLLISREDMCDMDLAYAITIHKSQGSEFSRVHIVLPDRARNMMTRRLLYTAITRAKQQVIIYNQGTSLRDAIADRAETPRATLLTQRLKD